MLRTIQHTARQSAAAALRPATAQYPTVTARNVASSSAASQPQDNGKKEAESLESKAQDSAAKHKSTKTQAQLDEELRQKMMGLSGDGGESGVEYEDGQPVSMKRSVKNNMFRYI